MLQCTALRSAESLLIKELTERLVRFAREEAVGGGLPVRHDVRVCDQDGNATAGRRLLTLLEQAVLSCVEPQGAPRCLRIYPPAVAADAAPPTAGILGKIFGVHGRCVGMHRYVHDVAERMIQPWDLQKVQLPAGLLKLEVHGHEFQNVRVTVLVEASAEAVRRPPFNAARVALRVRVRTAEVEQVLKRGPLEASSAAALRPHPDVLNRTPRRFHISELLLMRELLLLLFARALPGCADNLCYQTASGSQPAPPVHELRQYRLQGDVEMALSGWEYAAESLSIASGEARAFVERAPHLALGVIVRDKDVDKARRILDACDDLELDVPVVVAPESAVREADSSAGFVFGPSNDAHFDRNAGSELFQRRTASLRTVREQIEREESLLGTLRTLDFRLAEFRATYPRGWFAAQAEKVRTAEEWADDRAEHHRQAVARRNALISELEQVGQRIQGLDTEISGAERQAERIDGHIAQFGVDLAPERQRAAELETKAAQEEAFADEATERAEQHAAHAAVLNEEIVAAEGAIGGRRERESRIKHLGNEPIEPQPGNLAEYEAKYSQRLAHYRKEIGEDATQALAEQEQERARNQRAQFRKLLPSPADEAEVIALVGTMSPEEAEAQREAALNSPLMGAVGAIGNAVQRETRAQGEAKEARDFARGLMDLPEIVPGENGAPADADVAAAWLPVEKKVIDELRERVEAANGEALQVEAEAQLAEQQAKTLGKDVDRLRTLRQSNEILIAGYAPRPPAAWRPPENDAAIGARLNQVEEELYTVGQEQQKLNARLDRAIAAINQWTESDHFAKIAPDSAMVRDIRARSPRETEDDAERILQELDLRLAHINRTIAEVDRHRATLVEQMLSAAERGVQLLKAAETQSQLPAHMPRFGKMNFLKVRLGDSNAADRRARMEILLDEVINRESIPSGPKLVQDAVKRLGHPIEVLMLFPDPLRDAEYKPVQHMGINSGGEQLTMAVLLYCTLAQLRARNLGRHRVTTSTLLLDNPFGAASRASFIELQMEVARAARIQLVYTTGIKDWDAVAMFPNVNRIRPGGVDLNTGEFLLERDSVGTGMAVAQLYRNPKGGRQTQESPLA